jgi:hypothetical protein
MKTQTLDIDKSWVAVLTGPTDKAVTMTTAQTDIWLAVDSETPVDETGHLLVRGLSVLVSLDEGEVLYARAASAFAHSLLAFTS